MSQQDQTQMNYLLEQARAELSDLVLGVRADGTMHYVSASVETVLGYSDRVFQRLYNHAIQYADDKRFLGVQKFIQRQLDKLKAEIKTGYACEPEILAMNHRDGFRVTLSVQCIPSMDPSGEMRGAVCICRDMSTRRHPVDNNALASAVFENTLTGIYVTDAEGKITQANQSFTRFTGYDVEEILGQTPRVIDIERYSPAFFQSITDSLQANDCWEGEIQHRHKDGHVFPAWVAITVLRDCDNKVVNTISCFSDITEKKNSENRIQRLAFFDPLTGLPNRSLFNDRLAQTISRAQRNSSQVALLLLDLDRFKVINDSLGHALGDALLHQVGQRISDCVRCEDTVARMGGDEFAVIIGDLKSHERAVTNATNIAEKIRSALMQPFPLRGQELFSSASVGIAFFPSDGSEPKTLLQNADAALNHAKSAGKNNYQFYTRSLNEKARQRSSMENELHQAVKEMQFELHYQPIVSLIDGHRTGYEALVRWKHPDKGLILPNEFISIAEETGLIRPLGSWVLRQACQQWKRWRRRGGDCPRIAMNVSALQFSGGYLVSSLQDVLSQQEIPAGALEVEITESVLMHDHQFTLQTLEELTRLGIGIVIDNFGIGYSSLNYLKRFPVTAIKVDRSFVAGLPAREDQRIVQAIVALAHSLGLRVTAEGVESKAQLDFLTTLGCDEAQGYLLSQPVPARRALRAVS